MSYFSFTKADRRALWVMLLVAIGISIGPKAYRYFTQPQTNIAQVEIVTGVAELKVLDSQATKSYDATDMASYAERQRNFPKTNAYSSGERFNFDPNTATMGDWQRLGASKKTAETIQKYLSKGGKFRQPSDLLKIYSMPKPLAEALIPYVQIYNSNQARQYEPRTENDEPFKRNTGIWAKKEPTAVDINTADSSAFEALPGIGAKLAARIVNYRQKLGGFHSKRQIAETYGLPDSTFQRIEPQLQLGATEITKININTADARGLKHPYLSWNQANAIAAYRQQHGPFDELSDLRKIILIDQATYEKVVPYLTLK